VLALLGHNVSEVEASALWWPLAFSLLGSLAIYFLLWLVFRDWNKTALGTFAFLLLFFSYGHVYNLLKAVSIGEQVLGRHRFLIPAWLALGLLSLWWAGIKSRLFQRYIPALNLISVFLLIYPTFQIATYTISESCSRKMAAEEAAQQQAAFSSSVGYMPDVYYIILDAYGRADLLRTVFDYDNTPFLNNLEAMGFYVAECSQSNYAQSMLSITSSLNMNYLDGLSNKFIPGSQNRAPLRSLGKKSITRRQFEKMGYTTVSFATNFPASEWEDADYYLEPPAKGMNEFETQLAETSIVRAYLDTFSTPPEEISADWYRRRTLFALHEMEETVPTISSPKFVFVHLVIPHHPFVFGPNGEEIDDIHRGVPPFPDYVIGYRNQVTYINKRVEKLVYMILETSPNPPIIIIQGDHGPAPFDVNENRMLILNAYFFPGKNTGLYPTITPVNTFRLVFNNYFGRDLELLDDISYFSEYGEPYDYEVIPNSCAK
jgi:hypothetical protein